MDNTQDVGIIADASDEQAIQQLGEWHPKFCLVKDEMEGILESFANVMSRYRDILLDTGEEPEYLEAHVQEEAAVWFFDRCDRLLSDVWDGQS